MLKGDKLTREESSSEKVSRMAIPFTDHHEVDPAVIAAPAITTVVDVTGMVIYFTIARALLGL